ncbi:LacI family DNA-binding transcriptional regulator [Symbiobacterium thermophilum]|uniref:LacI family transcriptional regulator n=1 Tax=Symbiobacterium thermophilum TaxID=2734 RepID=A0A953LLJ4_SYMTR|nr:LacI family DNA-binding transcriptional regulator [Symbiobacterium thermophilum]MBY6278227.1 LacI family transcriptional regulator [Symbiobacterium thermophilum]
MKKRSVSIKEISELAGVSVATVSRVINRNGRYSKETEQRVLQIIEEYGYQPDLVARGLRTRRLQVVGVIVPDITNEFFARVTQELQNNLFALGYSTIICNTNEEYEKEKRYLAMLRAQKVSGLIYISGLRTEGQPSLLVPTVYIDRKPPRTSETAELVFIESANEEGGYLATRSLLDSGCRRVGLITYRPDISSHGDRLRGYRKALEERGLPFDQDLVVQVSRVSMSSGFEAALQLMRAHPEIDGFFCTADLLAYGVLSCLSGPAGMAAGRRIRLVGFDDLSFSGTEAFSLSSVRQSVEEFGRLGAYAVVQMIEGKPLERKHYRLPVELVLRNTTR